MSIKLIERWNTEELIEFFKRQDIISLHLEDEEYEIIRKIKMSGRAKNPKQRTKQDQVKNQKQRIQEPKAKNEIEPTKVKNEMKPN